MITQPYKLCTKRETKVGMTVLTVLTIDSFPFKYGVHLFNKLIREISARLCNRFLITSTGARMYFHTRW